MTSTANGTIPSRQTGKIEQVIRARRLRAECAKLATDHSLQVHGHSLIYWYFTRLHDLSATDVEHFLEMSKERDTAELLLDLGREHQDSAQAGMVEVGMIERQD